MPRIPRPRARVHKRRFTWALVVTGMGALAADSAFAGTTPHDETPHDTTPLEYVQSIELRGVAQGPYADHMALDVAGQRLFTTPQAAHAVAVVDLRPGGAVRMLRGFENPHAVLFRADRHRLFVSDGAGVVHVLDSDRYRRLGRIALAPNADSMAYDDRTHLLYVGNGGDEAGMPDSRITLIDTVAERAVADIVIATPALEAMIVDPVRNRLYVNAPEENSIVVIDLDRRVRVATWRLDLARRNEAFALDAANDRLYVGCNEGDVRGALVVVEPSSGRELERLPLGSWVDSMSYDARRQRLYASTGIGEVYAYQRRADGGMSLLAPTDTAVMARTSLFDPTLDRLFVMVPHLGWTNAKVLVFKPR